MRGLRGWCCGCGLECYLIFEPIKALSWNRAPDTLRPGSILSSVTGPFWPSMYLRYCCLAVLVERLAERFIKDVLNSKCHCQYDIRDLHSNPHASQVPPLQIPTTSADTLFTPRLGSRMSMSMDPT